MRPNYHFAPAANWLSDPNGLVHHNGEWHLFYQYNPQGEDWGHMSWGHAVSRDLASWEELPPALLDDERYMIFSGSAVIDTANSAGFGRDAMVAIYTGAQTSPRNLQVQCLASSSDDGRTWTKFSGNPVLDLGEADFRDPNVFWHAPTARWVMVVVLSNEQRALIYTSSDLKAWTRQSDIAGGTAAGEVWECPLLIELPVEGTNESRWLFKVDALRGAPGSGALYQVGSFDGTRFTPDRPGTWQVADMGREFYAAIAWHQPRDAQRRPLWIGWMGNHAYQGRLPRQGWRGAMSLPRRMSLRPRDGGHVLRQQAEPASIAAVPSAPVGGATVPLVSRIELPANRDAAVTLSDSDGRLLIVERHGCTAVLTRRDPVSPFLDSTSQFALNKDAALTLWLDHGSAELFGDDGTVCAAVQHRMKGPDLSARYQAAD